MLKIKQGKIAVIAFITIFILSSCGGGASKNNTSNTLPLASSSDFKRVMDKYNKYDLFQGTDKSTIYLYVEKPGSGESYYKRDVNDRKHEYAYIGKLSGNKPDGFGILFMRGYEYGDNIFYPIYVGDFKNGRKHGYGIELALFPYAFNEPSRLMFQVITYEGTHKKGEMSGQGYLNMSYSLNEKVDRLKLEETTFSVIVGNAVMWNFIDVFVETVLELAENDTPDVVSIIKEHNESLHYDDYFIDNQWQDIILEHSLELVDKIKKSRKFSEIDSKDIIIMPVMIKHTFDDYMIGTFKKNAPTNTVCYKNGVKIYEGEFNKVTLFDSRSSFSGKGKMYYPSGQLKYNGKFKSGNYHGKGKLYNEDGTVRAKTTFENGIAK